MKNVGQCVYLTGSESVHYVNSARVKTVQPERYTCESAEADKTDQKCSTLHYSILTASNKKYSSTLGNVHAPVCIIIPPSVVFNVPRLGMPCSAVLGCSVLKVSGNSAAASLSFRRFLAIYGDLQNLAQHCSVGHMCPKHNSLCTSLNHMLNRS